MYYRGMLLADSHFVVALHLRNRWLGDALNRWAFWSLAFSPLAHHESPRQLANRQISILEPFLGSKRGLLCAHRVESRVLK
jgi:hypothetical protein